MNRTGYKEMLRNQMPKHLDLSLRWTKSKVKWLNYVYSEFIGIFVDKNERYKTVKYILKYPQFDKNINWDWINEEDEAHWRYVKDWDDWFIENYEPIKQLLIKSNDENTIQFIKTEYMSNLSDEWQTELIDFITKNK